MTSLISRYPVTGGKQDLYAYRLGTPDQPPLNGGLMSLLTQKDNAQGDWLLKQQRVILQSREMNPESIDRSLRDRVIVAIESDAGDAQFQRAQALRALGYGVYVALDPDHPIPHPLLQTASHIGIPSTGADLQAVSKTLRKFPAKQVAGPVNCREQFDLAQRAGVDFVDGYYFSESMAGTAKAVNPAYTSILGVMQLAQQNAPMQKIEDALKRDASLSFRLLRYINSAGLGLSCEISSFRHAVTIIGYQNLSRWLSLLLVSAAKEAGCPALMSTAVVRGRLTELLGASFFDKQERDNLFIVGVFSMLDVMLQMPMASILEQIPLAETIADALIDYQGNYGAFLELAQCCEQLENEDPARRAVELMESLQLTADQVNRAHLQSLGWTEGLDL